MFWLRLTLSSLLLVLGGLCILGNAWIGWRTIVRRAPAPSPIPLVGGVLAAAGVALLPFPRSWMWSGAPFLLDLGGAPGLLLPWKRAHPIDEGS